MISRSFALSAFLCIAAAGAFQTSSIAVSRSGSPTQLCANSNRRDFLLGSFGLGGSCLGFPLVASANVFLDPAMYGDQELRVAAVDSLREKVRQAILKNPDLAPSFYQLALLDGLSFDASSKKYGPDGTVVQRVLSSKDSTEYMNNLKTACDTLIQASIALKKYTAITIGDAVAIGGAESINAIGGPVLPVQLGRTEPPKGTALDNIPLNIFNGQAAPREVQSVFRGAGLTEREMTALLGGLYTLETVGKTRSTADWKKSTRAKFREPGKMGRMSEFKRLTDEDIAAMEEEEEEADEGWYIADSFGTREQAWGQRIGVDDIDEKSFNKYLKSLNGASSKKGGSGSAEFGWIGEVLLDKDNPTSQAWVNKYAGSNLSYLKDLSIAYNAVTQLGAEYTGGKYENLLKNRPRKSLNDDDMKLF